MTLVTDHIDKLINERLNLNKSIKTKLISSNTQTKSVNLNDLFINNIAEDIYLEKALEQTKNIEKAFKTIYINNEIVVILLHLKKYPIKLKIEGNIIRIENTISTYSNMISDNERNLNNLNDILKETGIIDNIQVKINKAERKTLFENRLLYIEAVADLDRLIEYIS